MLLNPKARFDLAVRLRTDHGAPLGEVFSFLSGLYFRGKLAYAHEFGRRRGAAPTSYVITTDRGLVVPQEHVRREDLLAFSRVDIGAGDDRYIAPLHAAAERLHAELTSRAHIVLLGSIASGKYVDTLTRIFGERLLFPSEFVGRGDMSRGGLLLRCVREGRELEYQSVLGAVRRGKRPPKLEPLR
ncbi:MAG TPA: hypothetical protein VHB25_16755 [Gemmatimonadaceae bacterium]|nr:hypothetical protein [Gemmatimonadaceae bacterium]